MKTYCLLSILLSVSAASSVFADTFFDGVNAFNIEFVTIGSPGNAADTTGSPSSVGSLSYVYRIGKYEISEDMIDKANAVSELGITKFARGPNKPATGISWFEAAKFVNLLNTSKGFTPAYKFNGNNFDVWSPADFGYNSTNLFRNSQAKYFLPSVDEWYKAAYYDPVLAKYYDYPNGSDLGPLRTVGSTENNTAVYGQVATEPADIALAGGPSPFGTVGQGGNVMEWDETDYSLSNNLSSTHRGHRGGHWENFDAILRSHVRGGIPPDSEGHQLGFRIASTAMLHGDYNFDNVVDAADYTIWRDGLGTLFFQSDYEQWKTHFGQTLTPGAGSGVSVPEHTSLFLTFASTLSLLAARRSRRI
jgi:formylglycine-generating enzyme